jgi:hypothetical protein
MHIVRLNKPIFDLPESHPAHRFLIAFIKCRRECVGRELDTRQSGQTGVDQKWYSDTDSRFWTFSEFAYTALAFDIELDGWIEEVPALTASEKRTLESLPYLRTLMEECRAAAQRDGNSPVLKMVSTVLEMLDLWQSCIEARAQKCVKAE